MINLDWVKDYIDIADEDLKELAVKITKAGINVEKVIFAPYNYVEIRNDERNKNYRNVFQASTKGY